MATKTLTKDLKLDTIDKKHMKFDKDARGQLVSGHWTTVPVMRTRDIHMSLRKGMHFHGIGQLIDKNLADAYEQVLDLRPFRPDINVVYNVQHHMSCGKRYVSVDFGMLWYGRIPKLPKDVRTNWTHLDLYPYVWSYIENREHAFNNMWIPKAVASDKSIIKLLPDNKNILSYTIACWSHSANDDYRSGRKDLYNKHTRYFSLNQFAKANHLNIRKLLSVAHCLQKRGLIVIYKNNDQYVSNLGQTAKDMIDQQVLPKMQKEYEVR